MIPGEKRKIKPGKRVSGLIKDVRKERRGEGERGRD